MRIKYSAVFLKTLKRQDVRIRKSFKQKIKIFEKNPHDLELNNHELSREYQGQRSIDITSDWRAIYKEVQIDNEPVAYFVILGTHKQLYKP